MKEHDPLTPATRKLMTDFYGAQRQPGTVKAAQDAEREAIQADAASGKLTAAEVLARCADFRQRRLQGDIAELTAIESAPEIGKAIAADAAIEEERQGKRRDAREAELADLAKSQKLSPTQLSALVVNDEEWNAAGVAIEGAIELRRQGVRTADYDRRADELRQSIREQVSRMMF